ncbi:hypothetical protein EV702DRAFT_1042315 [Suillus placidus]|uniref:Uncharacterized protein n=1 Tax=Suillus placidus TaxID=48579 RepID=A0A9P7A2G2_9AGAM|nr:hypothetical protein EV702DRAFT_1042315 [Suillus placidus]
MRQRTRSKYGVKTLHSAMVGYIEGGKARHERPATIVWRLSMVGSKCSGAGGIGLLGGIGLGGVEALGWEVWRRWAGRCGGVGLGGVELLGWEALGWEVLDWEVLDWEVLD